VLLKKIKLRNFRNYGEQDIDFNGRVNFIYGENGHGKTNILEAVSYISYGKSFLGSTEEDCLRFGEKEFCIEGTLENDLNNEFRVSLSYSSDLKKKTFLLNKEKVSSYSAEIFGKFPVVFFSPHSFDITYGNPSDRRRFFDILISMSNRLYLDYLKELNKILRLKNSLLKNYNQSASYTDSELNHLLDTYNEKLVEVSSEIIFRRLAFMQEFRNYFLDNFSMLVKEPAFPRINYYSEIFYGFEKNNNRAGELNHDFSPDTSFKELIQSGMNRFLSEKRKEEIIRRVSVIGPHRDDYIFRLSKNILNNLDEAFEIKTHASQGEHKTFIIALKLAEFDYLKTKKGLNPVMLLDDLLSELDFGRVEKVISHLNEFGQIFLTTTDLSYRDRLKNFYNESDISYFMVVNGSVQ